MTLGEYIKNKRLEKKITTYRLAKDLNINYQMLQKWEKNLSLPNAKNTFLLIDYLELDLNLVKEILYNQD